MLTVSFDFFVVVVDSKSPMRSAKFRGGLIHQILELIGPPRPHEDNPTPCPYILMQWTEQGVNNIRIHGHGVGLSFFGLGGPISSKIW